VRRAFGFVRDDVLRNTGNQQEPFVYGSLGGDDLPLVPAKAVPAAAAPAAPAPNPQAEARRDYELALQIGNKDALNAFLAQYPGGFYASLARIQLARIAAEEARVAATEKARLTEQERARLAAEGAQKAQQAKAEADARAAEQARIAAEKARDVAQQQAADAEQKRAATEKSAADSPAADRTAGGPPSADKPQNENSPTNLAALSPAPPAEGAKAGAAKADIVKSVQTELRRVGCLTADADGKWNAASQRSLTLFNRYAGTKFDVRLASADALDAIKLKPSRVCPLLCEHGFKPDGERCSRIVCAEGSFLNDDNECEKRRAKTPTARRDTRDRSERAARNRTNPDGSSSARPQASGQIVCGQGGCLPVARGCHVEFRTTAQGGPVEGGGGNMQICR
jgi:hypothetical protein